jgi:hypothetical protein
MKIRRKGTHHGDERCRGDSIVPIEQIPVEHPSNFSLIADGLEVAKCQPGSSAYGQRQMCVN